MRARGAKFNSKGDIGVSQQTTGRYVVVGTAGHIDHGKTALVQVLTGRNTDRMKEEQERGISIDIDFAPLRFPDGTLIGMVDVPGHERFVHNMVAGAAGIDGVLLVIDANEGIMPQTVEHIEILRFLGVSRGVVALTKCDTVDAEWVEMSATVVREGLSETPFATSPLIATSARTGLGIADLKAALYDMAMATPIRDFAGAFRLPVDKVFSIPGFGTVVSGTVWRGQVMTGEVIECLPGRRRVRVRGIQGHGQTVERVQAGRRAALNLSGVDHQQVRRGFVCAAPGTLFETKLVDARVQVSDGYVRPLRHRDRVHVHLGTAAVVGRVLLLEADELVPGEKGLAQILLEKALVCEPFDRFVLRAYSPVTTLGGGQIIDPNPDRLLRRKRTEVIARLTRQVEGSPLARFLAWVVQTGGVSLQQAMAQLGSTDVEARDALNAGVEQGVLQALPGGWYPADVIRQTLDTMASALLAHHHRQRFSITLPRNTLTQAVANRFSSRDLDWLVQEGQRQELWEVDASGVRSTQWQGGLSREEKELYEQLLQRLKEVGTQGITLSDLAGAYPREERVIAGLLQWAKAQGSVVEVYGAGYVERRAFDKMVMHLHDLYAEVGPFTVAQARDRLQAGRKWTVALLETLDALGATRRHGDVRRWVAQPKL